MKIYSLEEISNLFNEIVSAIEDGCRKQLFLVVKAAALSVTIISYKKQLQRGMTLVENSENLISALEKVEQSINFKMNACTTDEIIDKVTRA
ncbi:MAG: hypothetical protein JRJ00_16445, partial [Deltaproteobacteria bacterium]|nr:hypothetical protein [Deltaproteobacteria bacterium]